ncbi:protein phosphatase 2C domain-containing protein [Catenulispora sp. NF23]|uniref:protein phosphatase 2C domain-containing protein n=1 Tax=Catenulispora pinistramenti TaxID=2705254 RepID=UPI001BABDF61|nr:protein phosphatase 2C domain-containing protein [Catenulispora pinistramenti]MBS2534214.1 protein phosphatase 2C domain-containing protein [Catenulispora pinistramenti]
MNQNSHTSGPAGGNARLPWAGIGAIVVALAFLEVSHPPRHYAWVVYLCALAAVTTAGAAVTEGMTAAPGPRSDPRRTPGGAEAVSSFRTDQTSWYEQSRPTATVTAPYSARQDPANPVNSVNSMNPVSPASQPIIVPRPNAYQGGTATVPATVPTPVAASVAAVAITTEELSKAPRFGSGSKAHNVPWRVPEGPFPSGVAADQAQVGPLAVRGASVVGPGHRCGGHDGAEPGVPRQDAYRIGRTGDDSFLILAVADGISNARLSDTGANAAASYTVRVLRELLEADPDIAGLDPAIVFKKVAEQVADTASARAVSGSELATVLIATVLTVPKRRGEAARGWVAWVGDSSGWLLDAEQKSWEQRFGDRKNQGEYASNALSAALPDHPEAVQAVEFDLRGGAALALVTDGVGDAWTRRRVNEHFAGRWRRPLPIAEFLNDVDFDAQQRMDDRTAVVVWNAVAG